MRKLCSYFVAVLTILLSLSVAKVQAAQPPQQPPSKQAAKTNYKTPDFSKAELDLSGLNEKQQTLVLELLNNNICSCGCTNGTWANCIKTDKHCPFSKPMGAKVVELVKTGKSEDFVLGYFAGWKDVREKMKKANNAKQRKEEPPNKIYPVTTLNAPVKGPKDAPVTIIEYTDYQCPFCKRVQPTLKELLVEYQGKIRFATMNNPLSFHKNAMPAALAARAAGKQGKFWEMREILFENSRALDDANLIKYAKNLGLNIEKFNADRKDENLEREIRKEQMQAIRNNATGTPAFFINGKRLSGARPIEHFRLAVDGALKRAKK